MCKEDRQRPLELEEPHHPVFEWELEELSLTKASHPKASFWNLHKRFFVVGRHSCSPVSSAKALNEFPALFLNFKMSLLANVALISPLVLLIVFDVGVVDAVTDDEDPWSVFACPAQPVLTFSIFSPGSPFPPVQVCFSIIQLICKLC